MNFINANTINPQLCLSSFFCNASFLLSKYFVFFQAYILLNFIEETTTMEALQDVEKSESLKEVKAKVQNRALANNFLSYCNKSCNN